MTVTDTPPPEQKRPKQRKRQERTDLSDRRMLEAAQALILEVGTQRTTLKDVGERAGYSRGLASARFGSREHLFAKIANKCLRSWANEVSRKGENKTGLEALYSRTDAVASYFYERSDDARVMYILWFESVASSSKMTYKLKRFHELARNDIASLVEEGQAAREICPKLDAEVFACQFCGLLFGLCYQWVVNPDAKVIEASIDQLKDNISRWVLSADELR